MNESQLRRKEASIIVSRIGRAAAEDPWRLGLVSGLLGLGAEVWDNLSKRVSIEDSDRGLFYRGVADAKDAHPVDLVDDLRRIRRQDRQGFDHFLYLEHGSAVGNAIFGVMRSRTAISSRMTEMRRLLTMLTCDRRRQPATPATVFRSDT